jgi:hypothetical protein
MPAVFSRPYTVGEFKINHTPTEEYTPVFDKLLSEAIRCIKRLIGRGFILVSGSAVLAEVLRTSDRDPGTIFAPNNVDIYIPVEMILHYLEEPRYDSEDALYDSDDNHTDYVPINGIDQFIGHIFREFKQEGICHCGVEYQQWFFHGNDEDLDCEVFEDLEMKCRTVFRVKDLATNCVHPVKIQLTVVKYKDEQDFDYDLNKWRRDILQSFDINILQAVYDVDQRLVYYPTDPCIYDYILARRFYYIVKRDHNREMLPRIRKYRLRNFDFCGQYDEVNDIYLTIPSGEMHAGAGIRPDDLFLRDRNVAVIGNDPDDNWAAYSDASVVED